jgi:hypothetical protein
MPRKSYKKPGSKKKQYPELVMLLGKAVHLIWSEWMSYLLAQCGKHDVPIIGEEQPGDEFPRLVGKKTALLIPSDLVEDIQGLIGAKWEDLTDEQQEAFHEEVAKILEALKEHGSSLIASMLPAKEDGDG